MAGKGSRTVWSPGSATLVMLIPVIGNANNYLEY